MFRTWIMLRELGATFAEMDGVRMRVVVLFVLTVASGATTIAFSFIGAEFWEALSRKDRVGFHALLKKFALALVLGSPVMALYDYAKDSAALAWREHLTGKVLFGYMSSAAYYRMELAKDIDNPDQRIAEDVEGFTEECVKFAASLSFALVDLASFSLILLWIHPPLLLAVSAYAVLGTATALFLGHRLVGLNMSQIRKEADLRGSLIRVREHAEAIAFYGGERAEQRAIAGRLDKALDNSRHLIVTERNLAFFTAAYELLAQVLPAILVAPLCFGGRMRLGQVSQVFTAFGHVLYDSSILIDNFEELSALSASAERISTFLRWLRGMDEEDLASENAFQGMQMLQQQQQHHQPHHLRRHSHHQFPPGGLGGTVVALSLHIHQEHHHLYRGHPPQAGVSSFGIGISGGTGSGGSIDGSAVLGQNGEGEYSGSEGIVVGRDVQGLEHTAAPTEAVAVALTPAATRFGGAGSGSGTRGRIHTAYHGSSGNAWGGGNQRGLLRLDGVTVTTPDGGKVLLRGVDLSLDAGARLLIMGPSGVGKSSLLRAIAGLWRSGNGVVYRPTPQDTFFLPQRPYTSRGTLREQVMYPSSPSDRPTVTDLQLLELLDRVGLADLPLRALQHHRLNSAKEAKAARRRGTAPTTKEVPAAEEPAAAVAGSGSGSSGGDGGGTAAGAFGSPPAGPTVFDGAPTTLAAAAVARRRTVAATKATVAAAVAVKAAAAAGATAAATAAAEAAATGPLPTDAAALATHPAALALALSAPVDWGDVLSLGEQQRLAFARLLFNGATLALLDEATSALEEKAERDMYRLVVGMPGLTLVSVGHRESLLAYHDMVMRIGSRSGGGGGGVEGGSCGYGGGGDGAGGIGGVVDDGEDFAGWESDEGGSSGDGGGRVGGGGGIVGDGAGGIGRRASGASVGVADGRSGSGYVLEMIRNGSRRTRNGPPLSGASQQP